jgi:hypothetical protein
MLKQIFLFHCCYLKYSICSSMGFVCMLSKCCGTCSVLTCEWEVMWTRACMRAMPRDSRMSQAIGNTTGRSGRATAAVCRRNISVQWPTPTHLSRYKKRIRLANSTHTCSNKEYNSSLQGYGKGWFITPQICWTVSTLWGNFNIQNTLICQWLAVNILTDKLHEADHSWVADSTFAQMNPIHIFAPWFFTIHLNTIFP